MKIAKFYPKQVAKKLNGRRVDSHRAAPEDAGGNSIRLECVMMNTTVKLDMKKMTQPPNAFTDASLLAAMTGIARFVRDTELRKVLRDTDGLGTEATRSGIVELLFKRGFLQ